jgi:hypothetical protein
VANVRPSCLGTQLKARNMVGEWIALGERPLQNLGTDQCPLAKADYLYLDNLITFHRPPASRTLVRLPVSPQGSRMRILLSLFTPLWLSTSEAFGRFRAVHLWSLILCFLGAIEQHHNII